jgi:hypothetical protein
MSRPRRPSSDGMAPWKLLFESWSFERGEVADAGWNGACDALRSKVYHDDMTGKPCAASDPMPVAELRGGVTGP